MPENLSALSGRKGLDDSLFEKYVDGAKKTGSPDSELLRDLAKEFLLGKAVTYGAASFYDFLKPDHKGKKVHVCNGSACLLANTQNDVNSKLLSHFKDDEIGHMCCLGRCYENAAFQVEGANYSGDDINDLDVILSENKPSVKEYIIETNLEKKVLTADKLSVQDFEVLYIKLIELGADNALNEITQSNIRGRGGAGFPMGFKWESCKNSSSDQKYIVCNADEGDPGAFSDRYLLEEQPLSVLFGMLTAGYITGATRGVLYIRGEYPESVTKIRETIDILDKAGLQGENIKDSGFDFRFKVIEGAGSYVCGEETALLSSIEGQRPEVRIRPPYPTQDGLFNKPTIVNNVETLAAVPFILSEGSTAYSELGTSKSTGTKLISLDSFFNNPGVVEVEMGIPFNELIYNIGGGFKAPVKAVHVGGPLGGIVPISKIKDLNLDFESFSNNGFLLGHAGIVSIPEEYPMINYLEHLFEFTAAESCGKCFPCSIGSVRGREMITTAIKKEDKIDRVLMEDLLETLEVGSLCALGGGLPLGVRNALEYFKDELEPYFK
ncbi:MAG: NADH-ubiquinone oxidoreductase-F iron-sulfur binding region domain-containing protein [Bacteroidota bacterium]